MIRPEAARRSWIVSGLKGDSGGVDHLRRKGPGPFPYVFQKKHVTRTRKKPWTLFLELLGKRNFSPLKS